MGNEIPKLLIKTDYISYDAFTEQKNKFGSENKKWKKKKLDLSLIIKIYNKNTKEYHGSLSKIKKFYTHNDKVPIQVAIKEIKDPIKNKNLIENEIKILKELKHKNIIKLYDILKIQEKKNENTVLILEAGKIDLNEIIKMQEINLEHIRYYSKQILEGLEYLHFKNIVHNDIKPKNIILTQDGKIKIIDFGNATVYKKSISGTEAYLSPDSRIDKKFYFFGRDIFAFGLTLYLMLGFKILSKNQIKQKFTKKKIELIIQEVRKNYPYVVSNFLEICLEHNPLKRKSAYQLLKHSFFKDSKDINSEIIKNSKSTNSSFSNNPSDFENGNGTIINYSDFTFEKKTTRTIENVDSPFMIGIESYRNVNLSDLKKNSFSKVRRFSVGKESRERRSDKSNIFVNY